MPKKEEKQLGPLQTSIKEADEFKKQVSCILIWILDLNVIKW